MMRKLHNEELHSLYSSPQIKKDEVDRVCTAHGETINANNILIGKSKGRRPVGRSRHRWEDNIKMDLRGIGLGYRLDSSGSG
jgi:hypothetical protein